MSSKKTKEILNVGVDKLKEQLTEKLTDDVKKRAADNQLMKKSIVAADQMLPKSYGKSAAELKELTRLSKMNQSLVPENNPAEFVDNKKNLIQPYGSNRAKNDKTVSPEIPALSNLLGISGLHFVCHIESLSPETLAVTEFSQEEGLSKLFTLTVTAVSQQADIDIKSVLLSNADFYVFTDGVPQRKISGVVASAKRGKTGAHRTFYTFTIKPHLWMLTLRKDSRIFHFKTVPQILESLLMQHNVPYDFTFFEPHTVREYTTQKRESDYELFCRLAAEEGISHWVECDIDGIAQVFFSDSRLGCTAGLELTYNPHPQSATTDKLLTDVDISATMMPGKVIAKDYNYHKPKYQLMHEAVAADEMAAQDRFTVFDSFGRFQSDAEGKPFTQYRLDALRAESELGTADGCCIQVRPGQHFSLSSHPDAALNATWQPVRVNHEGYLPQSMEEEVDNKGAYLTSHIEFVSSQTQWRPPFIPKPTVDGPEVAVVVGPAGEEIFTNDNGEIKIHFHWNRYDPADERASCWVRVIQSWMGDDWGFVSIPRIGQEVVVTYLDGDIDRPVVSGGVYNAQNRPPLNLPAEKTRTSFKSKTHKGDGFNEIRFEDAGNSQDFFMHAQKDMNTTVQNKQETTVKKGNKILTVELGDRNVTISKGNETKDISSGNLTETIALKRSTKASENSVETKKGVGKQHYEASTEIKINVGTSNIVLDMDKIELSKGASKITINEAGVFIEGDVIHLNKDK